MPTVQKTGKDPEKTVAPSTYIRKPIDYSIMASVGLGGFSFAPNEDTSDKQR